MAKTKTKKQAKSKDSKVPVEQGKPTVGYKHPPKEHQFKPGQSGNPKGPPIRRTNLWVWFCKYMNMTDKRLEKLVKTKLTQAQQSALKLVKNMRTAKASGSERLALSVFDREEGRAVEHMIIGEEDALTDEECEQIRQELSNNAD